MIERLAIDDVWLYTPKRIEDERGWFSEAFNSETLSAPLQGVHFVQDNQVFTRDRGVLRGLHFQTSPRAQDKLVRVLRGEILDVAVDIRRQSPSYGSWVSARLSAVNRRQIFVPKGFAHGYITLVPDTEVFYKVSDTWSKGHERGLAWDDPALGIDWEVGAAEITLAPRDRTFSRLADLPAFF